MRQWLLDSTPRPQVWARAAVAGAIVLAMTLTPARAGDVPEQYQVWGQRAKPDKYLRDAGLDTPGTAEVTATEEELRRGFIVFAPPAFSLLTPEDAPKPEDRCAALEAHDCRNQYGGITFSVWALHAGSFSVRVGALTGPEGQTIAAENFDARVVRCAKVSAGGKEFLAPVTLESVAQQPVAARRAQQFWITYHIPEHMPAGTYTGAGQVFVDGAAKVSLPLRLTVYPFDLVEPEVALYFYDQQPGGSAAVDRAYGHWVDQRCHGMNTGTLTPPVDYKLNDLKRDELGPLLDAYRKVGFARPEIHVGLWNRIIAEWLGTPDRKLKMTEPWFRYHAFSRQLDEKYLAAAQFIADQAQQRGLHVVLSVADEPGSHPWTIPAAQHYNRLLKDRLPGVGRELTCGGGWAMGQPEQQLWKGLIDVWATNRWLPDQLALVHQDDPAAKVHLYNMAGPGSGPGSVGAARNFFGFFAWKAHADGVAQWVYYFHGQPDQVYVRPPEVQDQGMVPTLRWEAVREGAKDRRYLATLEHLLADRKDPAAAEARRFLQGVSDKIELTNIDYDPATGGRLPALAPQEYQQWRDASARFIEELSPGPHPAGAPGRPQSAP
jgi:hypothetical protein